MDNPLWAPGRDGPIVTRTRAGSAGRPGRASLATAAQSVRPPSGVRPRRGHALQSPGHEHARLPPTRPALRPHRSGLPARVPRPAAHRAAE
jgi:hypothetical protein